MNRESAFTLIEMLCALFILSIIMSLSIPSWRHFQLHQDEKVLQSTLIHLLQFAREVAQIDQRDVEVSIKHDAMQVSHGNQLIRAESLHLGASRLMIRGYPWYRTSLRFAGSTINDNDNGMLVYCRLGKMHPAWVVAVGKSGWVHAVSPNQHGVILDSRDRVVSC